MLEMILKAVCEISLRDRTAVVLLDAEGTLSLQAKFAEADRLVETGVDLTIATSSALGFDVPEMGEKPTPRKTLTQMTWEEKEAYWKKKLGYSDTPPSGFDLNPAGDDRVTGAAK